MLNGTICFLSTKMVGLFCRFVLSGAVISESLMKGRSFPDAPVDQVGVTRAAESEQVRLHRDQQFHGWVWKLAQNGLTPDDDELLGTGDACRGTNYVFKLRTLHGASAL